MPWNQYFLTWNFLSQKWRKCLNVRGGLSKCEKLYHTDKYQYIFPSNRNKILEFPDISLIIQTDYVVFLGEGRYSGGLVGTADWVRDKLKMSVNTSASSEEQTLKARPGMLSGPAASRGLVLLRTFHTSVEATVSEELRAASAGRITLCWLVLRCRTYLVHLVACWSWLWPCCSSAGNQ